MAGARQGLGSADIGRYEVRRGENGLRAAGPTVVILSRQRDARCNRLPVGGCGTPPAQDRRIRGQRPNATHGDQPAGIWSGVTLIPPALTVARNGFGHAIARSRPRWARST